MTSLSNMRALLKGTAVGVALLCGQTATAQEVVLRSNDGSATITGELIEFADGFYRLRTELGELRLSAARMVCEGADCPELEAVESDLVFAGSAALGQGIMPLLLAGWGYSMGGEAQVQNGPEPNTAVAELVANQGFGDVIGNFMVRSETSDDAFADLEEGSAQIGMSARRITPAEARALRSAGAGNMVDVRQEHIIAIDPVTVIVHPSNRVENLTMEQLEGIFSGRITSWRDVGGRGGDIKVVVRDASSATRTFFDERVLNGSTVSLDATVVDNDNQVAAAVNDDDYAIGYVSYAFLRGAKPLSLTSPCGITSKPDPFASSTEAYPLDRRLYLYAREDGVGNEQVQSFLDFATSTEADGAIAKSGFVDLSVKRSSQVDAEAAVWAELAYNSDSYVRPLMAEMASEMRAWDRLSTTLRFATGSSQLDERGVVDMERLIDYLQYEPRGTQVALVGFTDNDGAFEGNRVLAGQRATQALRELQSRADGRVDHIEFTTKRFGQMAPSACNDSAEGKRINRRVEVWITEPAEGTEPTAAN